MVQVFAKIVHTIEGYIESDISEIKRKLSLLDESTISSIKSLIVKTSGFDAYIEKLSLELASSFNLEIAKRSDFIFLNDEESSDLSNTLIDHAENAIIIDPFSVSIQQVINNGKNKKGNELDKEKDERKLIVVRKLRLLLDENEYLKKRIQSYDILVDNHDRLLFYGMPGQGKTYIIRSLKKSCKPLKATNRILYDSDSDSGEVISKEDFDMNEAMIKFTNRIEFLMENDYKNRQVIVICVLATYQLMIESLRQSKIEDAEDLLYRLKLTSYFDIADLILNNKCDYYLLNCTSSDYELTEEDEIDKFKISFKNSYLMSASEISQILLN